MLVEGLNRAGRDLTREKLIAAIESILKMDVGLGSKLLLDCSSKNHKGSDSVYATIIRSGHAVVINDWKDLPD